jgi:hypothetical protein
MRTRSLLLGIITLLSAAVAPSTNANTIELPSYGFQIDALDGTVGDAPVQALAMFLPAADGFAANINVQIQPYKGSMKDYIGLSKGQFAQMRWKIIAEQQPSENEWTVEYSGELQGKELHFYARSVSKNGRVYVATATAKESQWRELEAKLRKNVDSLKLK